MPGGVATAAQPPLRYREGENMYSYGRSWDSAPVYVGQDGSNKPSTGTGRFDIIVRCADDPYVLAAESTSLSMDFGLTEEKLETCALSYVPCSHYCDQGLLLMAPLFVLICCSCCSCCAREHEERRARGERGCCGGLIAMLGAWWDGCGVVLWACCGRCGWGVRFRDRWCNCCTPEAQRRRRRRDAAAARRQARTDGWLAGDGADPGAAWRTPGWVTALGLVEVPPVGRQPPAAAAPVGVPRESLSAMATTLALLGAAGGVPEVGSPGREAPHPQQLCSICLGPLDDDDGDAATADGGKEDGTGDEGPSSQLLQLPCGHLYHWECGCQWLQAHVSCPECRALVCEPEAAEAAAAGGGDSGTAALGFPSAAPPVPPGEQALTPPHTPPRTVTPPREGRSPQPDAGGAAVPLAELSNVAPGPPLAESRGEAEGRGP